MLKLSRTFSDKFSTDIKVSIILQFDSEMKCKLCWRPLQLAPVSFRSCLLPLRSLSAESYAASSRHGTETRDVAGRHSSTSATGDVANVDRSSGYVLATQPGRQHAARVASDVGTLFFCDELKQKIGRNVTSGDRM